MAIFTIYFTEIEELKRKVNILKDGHTDSGQEHLRIQQELDGLQIRQDNIKTELSLLVQTDDSKLRKVSATASDINVDLADAVVNNDLYSEINESADVRRDSDKTNTVDTATVVKDEPHQQVTVAMNTDKTSQCKESLGPKPSDAEVVTRHKVDKQTVNRKLENSNETGSTVIVESNSTIPHVKLPHAPEPMGAIGGKDVKNTRTDGNLIINTESYRDGEGDKAGMVINK